MVLVVMQRLCSASAFKLKDRDKTRNLQLFIHLTFLINNLSPQLVNIN